MSYQDKLVSSAMTPIEKVYMLHVDSLLDFKTMSAIFKSGFSRIPVFGRDRNTIVGMLLTKDLIVVDPEESTTVKAMLQFFGRNVEMLYPDQKLGEALALFKSGRTHLAMVHDVNNQSEDRDPFYEVRGLLTLEDIIEEQAPSPAPARSAPSSCVPAYSPPGASAHAALADRRADHHRAPPARSFFAPLQDPRRRDCGRDGCIC